MGLKKVMKKINKIRVPNRLTQPHALIEHARKALESGFIDKFGTLYAPASYNEVASIRVSKSQLNRALRIANTLFKTIENSDGSVAVVKHQHRKNCETTLHIKGQHIPIKIEEISEKTEPFRVLGARGNTCYFKPTGRLRLKIDTWVTT